MTGRWSRLIAGGAGLWLASSSGFAQAQLDQSLIADLVLQVQQLQEEVRQLRGQVEQQNYQIERLEERQKAQYLDLDERLTDLQSGAVAAPAPNTPPIAALEPPTATDQPPDNDATANSDTQNDAGDTVAAVNPAMDEEGTYRSAFDHLKALRYVDAAEGFMDYLEQHPDSPRAGNAQYWLGESYYVTRNYEIALDVFQELLEKYPESNKVADAWLKIGYTHYELKNWDRARDALTRVVEQYSSTNLARLAENRLRTMRLEGHY